MPAAPRPLSKQDRISVYVSSTLALLSALVCVAYIIVASRDGFRLPHNATGMTAIWVALFATMGWVLRTALTIMPSMYLTHPRYCRAVHMLHLLLLAMLLVALVSLGCLGDYHGAVWSALAFCGLSVGYCSDAWWRKKVAGSPIVPLTQGLKRQGPGPALNPASCRNRCQACCFTCTLWTCLLLMTLFILGFGIGAALTAREAALYPAPGTRYTLTASSGSETTVKMHLHCTGTRANPSRPIIIFEHGGGSSSFTFYGVQEKLMGAGIRSCAYDRPGFGWSESLPVGEESVESYNYLLTSLLQAAGESAPYIMVGHSVGVELVQIFAAKNPSAVVGVSLLDGYPDYLRLMGYTDAQVKQDQRRVCSILQVARAFDAVGLVRPIYLRKQAFQPASEERRQASTYTNGHNWDSQWRTYCRSQAPDTTTYLTTAAQSTSGFGANPTHGMYLSAL